MDIEFLPPFGEPLPATLSVSEKSVEDMIKEVKTHALEEFQSQDPEDHARQVLGI